MKQKHFASPLVSFAICVKSILGSFAICVALEDARYAHCVAVYVVLL